MKFNSVNASTIQAIGGFRREGILSGPSAGVTFNNTEDPFNPQSGEIISLLGNPRTTALAPIIVIGVYSPKQGNIN